MAPGLESATTPSDGHAVVTVRGDIAADTAIELWQHLSYLVSQGHQHIVLDVGGMVLIDRGRGPGPGGGVGPAQRW
jgi:anti-anti-sigma regulatory factor